MSRPSNKKNNVETIFNNFRSNWIADYSTNGTDYVKKMFLYLVGDNMYRFIKFFNKELKRKFDSIPGLVDNIFTTEYDRSGEKIRMKDVFLCEDAFKCLNTCDDSYDGDYWFSLVKPTWRPDSYQKYFNGSSAEFEDFSKCYNFSLFRTYRFFIEDRDKHSYYNSSKRDDMLGVFVSPARSNLMHMLERVKIAVSSYKDEVTGVVSQYILLRLDIFYLKIHYRSDSCDTNEGIFQVDSFLNPETTYTELHTLTNSNARSVYIKSNKPLFDINQCMFFHLMEKLLRGDESLLQVYFENIRKSEPATQFVDQLFLKYTLLDNEVVLNLFDYLNSIKTTGITQNNGEILGTMLRWIYPGNSGFHQYDRYQNGITFKMRQEPTFPKWLDLKNKSLLENYINTYYYGQVINETIQDGETRRSRLSHDACPSLDALIDIANLKIDYYFKNLIKNYTNH